MTQVNNHKSTGHTSFLNGDSLATSAESLRLQAQRSLLLNRITTQLDTDYDQQINRALSLIRHAFELDYVIISRIEGANYTIKYIAAAQEGLEQGQVLDVRETYCELVYGSNEVVVINHASESAYKTHPCFELSQLESYVGAPLNVDTIPFGTVSFSNADVRQTPFTDIDLEFLQIFANWVSGVLSRKNAAEGLQQAVDNMTQLYQLTSILNRATTIEDLFLTAIQPSIKAGATFANLFTIQVDHNNRPEFLDMINSWSATGETLLPAGTRFKLSDFEISKYWIATRRPVFIGDIQNDERLTDAARAVYHQVGAKATITYPLTLQNRWVGVISLNWPYVRQFTEADQQQYEAMGHQTASVLYNLIHSEHESKRAHALEIVSKVSAAVSSILDMPELLQTVVNLTKEQFDLYHAHLYLTDHSANQLRLSSGAGSIGKQMVNEGRTIPLDAQQSLVARAARSTGGFIVNDVANEPGFLPHPLLPNTASELAVPIISGSEVLGVLDVQAAQINYFTEDDLDILNTLAAQIAPALQNAQAFEQIRMAQTAAQKAQDRTEAILKSTTIPLVITRVSDGTALYANEPLAKALRMPLDEIVGQKAPNFYHSPEDRQLFIKSLMENGYVENYELLLVRDDGDFFWALVSARLFDYEGDTSIVSTLADITDLKEAEDRIETILKSVNLPLAITRISDGYGMYANEPFGEVFHMSVDEFIGRKSPDFYADPADRAGLLNGVHEVGYTRNYETRLRRNDGEIFWALMSARAIQYDGQDSIMTTIIDITERHDAAEALRRNQEDLAIILESSPEAIGVVNTETGLFENPNTKAELLYGLPHDELVKVGPAQMSPDFQPDGRPSAEAAMEKIGEALQGGSPVFEWTHINSKGEEILCEVRLAGLGGSRSHLVRFSVTDISERKALEDELRLLQQAFNASTQPITIADMRLEDQPLVYVNPAFEKKTGYALEEIIGKNCRFLQNDDIDQEGLTVLRQALKSGEPCDVEIRNYHKDGTLFWNRLVLSPVKNAVGAVTHFIGSQQDITERKETEARLAKQATDLSTVAEVSTAVSTIQNVGDMLQTVVDLTKERFDLYHAHIFVLDEQKEILVLTAGAGEIGREMVAEGRQIPLTAEGSLVATVGRNLEGQIRNYEGEMEGFAPHPALIDTRTELAVPLTVGGELLGVLDVRSEQSHAFSETDVQTQSTLASQVAVALQNARSFEQTKQAEAELQANQTRLETILNNLPVGVFVADAQTGVPQLANQAALDLLGRGLDPSSGAADYTEVYQTYQVDADEPLPAEELPLVKTMTTGEIHRGQLDIMRPTDRITVDVTAVPIFNEDKAITNAIALFQDITERRNSEAELLLQSSAIEAAATGIAISDRHGRFIRVNSAFAQLTGFKPEEAIGKTARILKSGKQSPEFYQEMWKTILAGEVWQGELINKRKDGTLYDEEMTITPVRSNEHEITHFIAIKQDITERRKAAQAIAKQAAELQTVAQISVAVSSSLDTNVVLQEVVDLTKENFDLYHAHIYLLDASGENLKLTAGAGKVGRQMVAQSRSIPINAPSLVAQTARSGQATVANNVLQEANFLPNPLLPKTRSEMAVPIIFGGAVLGVLDVQSNFVNRFVEQDVNIQTTLATEIAVAIENARQYEQTQMALAETAAQAKSLEKLSALSLILANVEAEDEAFKTVAAYATEVVGSQRTSIALLNGARSHLELFAIDGTQGSIPTGMVLPVNGTAIGYVTQNQQLMTLTDTAQSEFMDAKKLSQTGVLSAILSPLFISGEIIGTINFGFPHLIESNNNRNQLIQQLTSLFGQTLANSRLLEQIQRQATQLRTVAELGTLVAAILEPQEMLQTVVDLTKERFDLYHTHVFLLDAQQKTLVLTAGADEVGREMVAEGRQIPVAAEGSLVATAARAREPQIRNYAGEMEGYAPHPALIDTRTEMAVPLLVGNQLLGILDVRSEKENAFDEADVQIQSTLASQVAIALQNAQQYEETQKANQEVGRLYETSQQINKATTPKEILQGFLHRLQAQGAHIGSLYAIETDSENVPQAIIQLDSWVAGGEPPFPDGTRFDLSLFAISDHWRHTGDIILMNVETDERLDDAAKEIYRQAHAAAAGVFPLKLGHDWVGLINVNWLEPQPFTDDDIRLYQSLVDQVAVVLNGYNLLQQTQERAAQLQVVSEVSTAVSSLQDSQEMLQTVVDLTKERFALYHTHTFLLDDAGETLILSAGAGDVGRAMVAEGRRIPVAAEGSLVATAARTRQAQIRNYAGEMEGYAPHPALIDTRTEMAVPLLAGDTLLGVLDVRSVEENAFGDIEVQIQSTLSSQVAIALQNARQFEQTERARRELTTITQRLTREGWEDFLVDRNADILRYGYNLQAVQTLSEDQYFVTQTGSSVSAPLIVQDTQLGQVAVELAEEPDNDTAEVIKSVVSNLSAHIENIRLNEQTFKALADTESLYHAINQIVRAESTNAVLSALVESTAINQMDRANLFMFNRPWNDIEPEYAIVDALWERGEDASESLAPSGTIYYINQITTIRSFKHDEIVVFNDILTDERVDPLSRQNLSELGTRTLYVFPLIVNQQWIGSVTAQSSEPSYELSETNLRQISTLTEQAATTIANRRLLAQAQERAERERRVRAITDRIRTGTTREDILKIAREEIGNLLGTKKSVVQLGTKQQLTSKLKQKNGHD